MLLTVTASPPATYIHPGRADVIQHWNMSWCSPSYFLFALLTLKYDLPSFCLLSHTLSLLNFLSWRTHIKQNSALLLHAHGSASIYLGTRIHTCCLAETDGQEVPFCPFQSIASHRDIHGSDFHHHRLVLPILCFLKMESYSVLHWLLLFNTSSPYWKYKAHHLQAASPVAWTYTSVPIPAW